VTDEDRARSRVDGLEVASVHLLEVRNERVHHRRPRVVAIAAEIPIRPIVRENEPVLLQGDEDRLGRAGEGGRVEGRLEAQAQAHGRQRRVALARRVCGRMNVGLLRACHREADGVKDRAS
jgi:hypothetical protein